MPPAAAGVTPADAPAAQRLLSEISWFGKRGQQELRAHLLPDWETLPYDAFSPHQDLVSERLATLHELQHGQCDVLIAPATTALLRMGPPSFLAAHTFFFKQGESLAEFLGGAAAQFDMLVDASPTGEIFLDAGTNKTEYLGNWKLVGMDGYHPNFVHASVVAGWARNSESGIGAMHREDPFSDEALTLTRDYGNGHAMLDFRAQRLKSYKKHAEFLSKVPGGVKYVEDMHKAYGQERAELLISLSGDPHLGVFPNLQLIGNQVRIITPIAPGMTQVTMSMVRLGGVSDEINTMRVRQHESFYGPAGSGSPDDAEIFERVQRGMMAEVNPWIEISRGMHREFVDTDGSVVGRITDEVPQRGQMKYWLHLMTQAA